MQPFQCDLQTQTQETHRTTYTGPSSVAKHIEGTKRPQPHPPHRQGTFHRRLQPLYTEKHKVSCSGFLPTTKPMQHSCSHSNAICKHKLKKRIELRTQEHPVLQNTLKERNDPSRTRRTDEVPFIVACSHFTRKKHKVSCAGFLPTTKPMQHSCSHSNAICKHKLKKRIELRTQEHPVLQNTLKERNDPSRTRRTDEVPFIAGCSHFTRKNTRFRTPASSPTQSPCNIMQPFQCDLPPQLQETHRTTHTGTTTRCKTHRRNNSRQKRPQPQPPHRQGTFHRRLQPLYTEKHKVSCSSFLPNTKPMQHHAAIPMRSATRAPRNA